MVDHDETSGEVARLRTELEQLRAALRTAEARAEQAERFAAMGRLVAGLVHELNNPLTAVTMYAEALALRTREGADKEKAAAIQEAVRRIQQLSRDLIGYARPGFSSAVRVDLSEVVEEALRLSRPELKASNAVVLREVGAAAVSGMRESLVQVAFALLSNAAQACAAGKKIRVALSVANGEATLTVADDGSGMGEEVQARVFEPFFTTRGERALGLGLSTARAIVERHGGRIALQSAPDGGTIATVVLPAIP
jgi:signal transduction histidine kinase